jgi:RHS repeat-associated protein
LQPVQPPKKTALWLNVRWSWSEKALRPSGRVAPLLGVLGLQAVASLFLLSTTTAAASVLPEKITTNTTLTTLGSPYTGNATVEPGVTLKVEPGVTLKIGALTVKGTLTAEGTAEQPIVFTGAKAEKAGEWESIRFESGSGGSVLDHVEVAYGGRNENGMIAVNSSSPRITNSVIRKSEYQAIRVQGGSPNIGYDAFSDNGFSAVLRPDVELIFSSIKPGEVNVHDNSFTRSNGISVWAEAGATGPGSLRGNSGSVQVAVRGGPIPGDVTENNVSSLLIRGTVASSTTWNNGGTKVRTEGNVTVASGATLTIGPGLVFAPSNLIINGTLKAEGTAAEPVVFTGDKAEKAGEWESIKFESGSGASVLDHVEVAYGGRNENGMIAVNSSSPRITNSVIRKSEYQAIRVQGGSSEIANNILADNGISNVSRPAVELIYSSAKPGEVNIHDNGFLSGGGMMVWAESGTVGPGTLHGNFGNVALKFRGGEIPDNISENNLKSILLAGKVGHDSTWNNGGTPVTTSEGSVTVAAGAKLTMKSGLVFVPSTLTVNGTLRAEGTFKEPVVFTGGNKAKAGEWDSIKFEPGSGASVLDYVEVAYGARPLNSAAVEIRGSNPTITNSTIRDSSYYGIKVTESGAPRIERNRFRRNTSAGLSYTGTGTLAAQNNDWGCLSGPKPAGCGDAVSTNVNWKPSVQLHELGGQCRGKGSQCEEGADPVSLATGQLNYSHRDLLLTNKSSVPLEFTRTYSSGSSPDTGLGPGWSQTGLATASEQPSGEVLIVRQDGRQDLFQKTESGYKAPSGVTDTLEKVSGTFQLTTLQGIVYRFDSSGRIASIIDSHGLKTTYGYDGNGRLATITDPSSQTLTFSYNSSNHITLVKDSTGREVKFAYSTAGDLESVTDALGGITKYAYDSQHRITQITDPRGNVILKNVYDSQGRITEQRDGLEHLWKLEYGPSETTVTEPQGGKRKYTFDSQYRTTSETDQLGHMTTTAYDAAGNVAEVVRPGGAKWTFGRDAAGNLTSVKDPEGGERGYEYDAKNHLVHSTDPGGGSWSYEWSAAGDLTKATDPEGGETTLTYNASGQPLTATDPDKHKAEFGWDTRGNQTSATDPLGHKTSFEYNTRNYLISKTLPGLKAETLERNALGDLLARTTPEGHKTKYAYDANGLPTQVTDPAEDAWKIERNAMERPTVYIDPLGHETKLSYNGDLQPVKFVDRRGQETTYAYDLANHLTEVTRPEGEVWKYGYDGRGNRSSVLDPRGNETTYGYDLLDRMTEAQEPLSVTTKYAYDANGDLTQVTDPRGNATTYAYDKLGRLTELAQPLEAKTSFTYDAAGDQLTKTTALGTLEYGYDAANRLTGVKSGGSTLRSYGYDSANRLTSATDAEGHKIEIGRTEEGLVSSIKDGRGQSLTRSYDPRGLLAKQVDGRGTVEYGYDKLGRLTSLTDPQGKALAFAYDSESNLTEITRPNGVATTNVFNGAGRLAETTSKAGEPPSVLESLKYGYDTAGNVTSKIDQRLEAETSYAYDGLNRLAEFNPPGEGSTAYAYDAAGNRTQAGATTYVFNALNQPTESSAGTTYSYDGAGRLTTEVNGSEETAFAWNPFDHLAKVEGAGGTVTYAFDGLERLSERKEGEATRVFHYGDLSDMATYETNGEGKTTTSYLQGPRGLVEQRSSEATSFPLVDEHGDVTAITDSTAAVESRQNFDPWGSQLSGPSLEMGYLGAWERPNDSASGLIQMGARSYDPALGSFVSEDPVLGHLGIGVSSNRYPYAWDNPVNRYDLGGRDVLPSLPGTPVCLLGCSPSEPHEIAERAQDFAKSDFGEWFGARGDEIVRAFECIAERVVLQPGPVGCQEAAEQWKPDPDAPDEEPRFPPPGIPGRGPMPIPIGLR